MDKYNPLSDDVLKYPRMSHIKGILKSPGLDAFSSFQLGRFYIYKLLHMIPMLLPLCFGKLVDEGSLKLVETLVKKHYIEIPKKYDHPANFTKEAFAFGTHVHTLVERYFKRSGFDDLTLEDQEIIKGLKEITVDWNPLAIEKPLCSKEHKFRGTCDLVASINGRLTLVDIKTGKGKNGVYNDYDLQLAAYKLMFEEQTGEEIMECGILMFCKDTREWIYHERNIHDGHTKAFLGARAAYEWHEAANASEKGVYDDYNKRILGI